LEHLNSAASPTALTSNDVPSVFETLAADELRDLIQPAFRYVLAVSFLVPQLSSSADRGRMDDDKL
jgi:hypothetical protein